MLTIAKLGVGQETYYLSKVASGIEDYYSGEGETPGAWLGRGAARLGLAGEVAGGDLRALLAGFDPESGERLAGREGMKRVPGWDLTFSAPKSVSVLYGLSGPTVAEQVVAAHEAAVAAGLAYLEGHATVSRRRAGGELVHVRGEGLVIAAFRHRTSRAGDPQLHTHALAANVVERVNGGWGALHSPVIYRHARTAGFVYQAILRGELTERLGVSWGPVHNGYAEVDGIPQPVLQLFSKRRAEIEEAMAEAGADSARAAQVAAHRTRSAKEYGVDPETLYERWEGELRAAGVEPDELAAVTGRAVPTVNDADLEWVIETMVAAEGLTAQQASFDRRDVTRAWCEALPAGVKVSLEAIEDLTGLALDDRRAVPVVDGRRHLAEWQRVRRADGSTATAVAVERRWSTRDMLAVEQALLERAEASRRAGAGKVPAEIVTNRLAGRGDLSVEQARMVRQLTTSGDGVEVVVGRAGCGKTYALAAAAEVWRAGGYRPIGLALAARAAAELEASAGIPSTTVAQFLIDADHAPGGLLHDRHVVVIDEAGMVDTRRLARVIRHVEAAGAKVVLVGDHYQLPAVEAGGAFAALITRLGAAELTENRRQRELWERDTLDRLRVSAGGRDGVGEVIAAYGDRGRLHLGGTPAAVRAAMVADWYDGRRTGLSVAMVALRRADVDELNARARALLVADGTVAGDAIAVGGRAFAPGDRVVCLNNDRRIGVHNAMFGDVVGVDIEGASLTVSVEGTGERLVIPRTYIEDGHLAHGYATTIHKAQGATFDRTLLLGDDRLYRQAGYTGLSRGRDRNDLYLVVDDDRDRDIELDQHGRAPADEPIERLVTALHRDGSKVLATEEASRSGPEIASLQPLSALWVERDELAGWLATAAPADWTEPLAVLTDAAEEARNRAALATLARTAAEERAAATRGLFRRTDAALAQRDLQAAVGHEQRVVAEWRELDEQRTAVQTNQVERLVWTEAHRDDLGRLAALERAIERRARLAGRAAEIDRPARIVDVLGDPPASLAGRERWRDAAAAIESYRARWDSDPGEAVAQPEVLSGVQREHVAHVEGRVARAIDLPDVKDQASAVELA